MPPVILTLLQALFLLLLYVFVARAVRAIARDLSPNAAATPSRSVRQAAKQAARQTRSGLPRRKRSESRRDPQELVVHLPDGAPQLIALDQDALGSGVTFGRAPEATVRLDDPYVSDHHARIYHADGGWMLADLGSTNGTYRNKEKVTTPIRLAAGDQVAIGKTVVEVRH